MTGISSVMAALLHVILCIFALLKEKEEGERMLEGYALTWGGFAKAICIDSVCDGSKLWSRMILLQT